MDKNTKNFNDDNGMETFPQKFPLDRLETNWPFSIEFTRDFFKLNKKGYYLSLKDFLISTWLALELENNYGSDSEDSSSSDLENNSSSDYGLENQKSWPILKYKEFFIEDNIVFFKESVTPFLTENELEPVVYSLDNIPYQTLICKNSLFYIDYFLKGKEIGGPKERIRSFSVIYIWGVVFNYLLFTKYSYSIKNILQDKDYTSIYKKDILCGFHIQFLTINSSESSLNQFCSVFKKESEEILIFKERFENVLNFSNISTNVGNKLFDSFFRKKNLSEVISYYETQF